MLTIRLQPSPAIPTVGLILLLLAWCIVPVSGAATTQLRVVKYASDGTTILDEQTITYQEMESTLPVMGDGVTHYYAQGPVFNGTTMDDRWNQAENDNVLDKDMGAVKGTDVKDLCELVGGASPGEEIRVKASDGFYKNFPYENIYEPDPRQGPFVVCWYNGEESITGEPQGVGYVPSYFYGMRLISFADTSTNEWGHHVFGNWDEHECLDEEYWHYYYSGSEPYPTTTGFTVRNVAEILIYSDDDPTGGSLAITSSPAGAAIAIDGGGTGEVTNTTIDGVDAGEHTVTLTLDGYEETTSTVTVETGTTSTLHLVLVSTDDSENEAGLSGYYGSQLETVAHGTVNGTVLVLRSTGSAACLDTKEDVSYTIPVDLPANDSVTLARVSVYTSGGWDDSTGKARSADLAVQFDGALLTEQRRSADRNASEKPVMIETISYDVTSLLKGSTDHIVAIENVGPRGTQFVAEGAVLIVVSRNESLPAVTYWIAEGCDAVRSDDDEHVLDDEATTAVEFSGTIAEDIAGARLFAVSTAAGGNDRAINSIAFNDGEWYNLLSGGADAIALAEIDAGPYLLSSLNEASIGSVRSGTTGDYLENRHAVLVVTHGQRSSAEVQEGTTPSATLGSASESETDAVPILSAATTMPLGQGLPQGLSNSTAGVDIGTQPGSQGNGLFDLFLGFFEWLLTMGGGSPTDGTDTGALPSAAANASSPAGEHDQSTETLPLSATLTPLPTETKTVPHHMNNATYNLSVSTKPPGALVFLDGAYTGKATPVVLPALEGGNHQVKVERDGYDSREETVSVLSDITVEFELTPVGAHASQREALLSLPDPKNGHSGGLYITSIPEDAAIVIDNKQFDWRTPHIITGLKEGAHTVQARIDELESDADTKQVWVYPGMVAVADINLIETPRSRSIAIESMNYTGEQFSFNGAYPLKKISDTITALGAGCYITIEHGGAYISYAIPETLEDLETMQIEPEARRFYSLVVETEPRGCDVFIDGYPTGLSTPNTFNVSDGPHRVMVQQAGYIPEEKQIDLVRAPNGPGDVALQFTLEDYPFGHLAVNSNSSGASIYLFGKNTGEKTPFTFQYIPIGSYDVKLVGGSATEVLEDVVVSPWEITTVDIALNEDA